MSQGQICLIIMLTCTYIYTCFIIILHVYMYMHDVAMHLHQHFATCSVSFTISQRAWVSLILWILDTASDLQNIVCKVSKLTGKFNCTCSSPLLSHPYFFPCYNIGWDLYQWQKATLTVLYTYTLYLFTGAILLLLCFLYYFSNEKAFESVYHTIEY